MIKFGNKSFEEFNPISIVSERTVDILRNLEIRQKRGTKM